MRPSSLRVFRWLFCLLLLLIPFALPITAQTTQCGLATSISFPVDTNQFQLVQDFGAPSPRHQGRYHTGEDWYGGRGTSYGTPVRAIANGQVTFSSPNGWGRDGGVIIISHAFPDGTTAYSMYGHVTDATGIQFPAPFTCIHEGDIIAAVGAPRPAPHLHFEIRTNQPDIPGPGYTDQDPVDLGWRRPSKFVDNWQAWFLKSTLWHADIADETGPVAPPVELPDHSLLVLDAQRVLRISSDGRVLWRINLDAPAVGLIGQKSGAMIVYDDAKMQLVDADGNRNEAGNIFTGNFDSPPMMVGSEVIFHTKENGLFAFNGDSTWQVSDVPPILRWSATVGMLGLMTTDNALLTIPLGSTVVNRALLREPGSLTSSNTDLLAYTHGGLWRIDRNGTWSLEMPDAPPGGRGSAVAANAQQLFLFDGTTLHAYDSAHTQQWATALPGVSGNVTLSIYDNDKEVLLTSNHGDIVALQASSGGVCNTTRIYGSSRAREWHSLGDDGVLRIYVADQIIGFNWNKFLMACAA